MATIKCEECGRDADNLVTGIYIVKKKGTKKTKMVCGDCYKKLIATGEWEFNGQAKSL